MPFERQWLEQLCDGSGECDRCHRDNQPLWEDADDPGLWMYCRDCWLKILRGRKSTGSKS